MMDAQQKLAVFYECEICGHCHPWEFKGDCRDDANRYTCEQLDVQFGSGGYELRTMDERVATDTGAVPAEQAPAEPIPADPEKPKRAKRERPKSRPQRWQDACAAIRAAVDKARAACDEVEQAFADLNDVRGEYVEWKENLSENLANSAVGEKLQAVEDLDIDDAHSELDSAISDLESKVDEAEGLDLPLGFGRD